MKMLSTYEVISQLALIKQSIPPTTQFIRVCNNRRRIDLWESLYTPNIAWTGRPCLLPPGWVTRETPATRKVTRGRTYWITIPFYGAVFAANITGSPGSYLAATRFARNAWFSWGTRRPGSGASSSPWGTSTGTGGPSTVRPRGAGTPWSWWTWPAGLRVIEWHRRPWKCSREMVLLKRYVYRRFANSYFFNIKFQ